MTKRKVIVFVLLACLIAVSIILLAYKIESNKFRYDLISDPNNTYIKEFNNKLNLDGAKLLMARDEVKKHIELEEVQIEEEDRLAYKNLYVYYKKNDKRIKYNFFVDIDQPLFSIEIENFKDVKNYKYDKNISILGIIPGKTSTQEARKILEDNGFHYSSGAYYNKDVCININFHKKAKIIENIEVGVNIDWWGWCL